MRFAIDASVTAKWFLSDEPFSVIALGLLRSVTARTSGLYRSRSVPLRMQLFSLESILQIARGYDRTFYDPLYIALAIQQQTHLVTADEKLANATAAFLPVKWIFSINY